MLIWEYLGTIVSFLKLSYFFILHHVSRDGDLYAAMRDCHSALRLDPNHLKAHFRLARCLYELAWPQEAHECLKHFKSKFPDYAKSHACEALDRDIKAAIFSWTDPGTTRPTKIQKLQILPWYLIG